MRTTVVFPNAAGTCVPSSYGSFDLFKEATSTDEIATFPEAPPSRSWRPHLNRTWRFSSRWLRSGSSLSLASSLVSEPPQSTMMQEGSAPSTRPSPSLSMPSSQIS